MKKFLFIILICLGALLSHASATEVTGNLRIDVDAPKEMTIKFTSPISEQITVFGKQIFTYTKYDYNGGYLLECDITVSSNTEYKVMYPTGTILCSGQIGGTSHLMVFIPSTSKTGAMIYLLFE